MLRSDAVIGYRNDINCCFLGVIYIFLQTLAGRFFFNIKSCVHHQPSTNSFTFSYMIKHCFKKEMSHIFFQCIGMAGKIISQKQTSITLE